LTVTCTDALLLASAAEVAVIVAVQDAVKADDAGAVYVTEAPVVADSVPHPAAGVIAHVIPPLLLSFATVAVNANVAFPVSVWGAVCDSTTDTGGLLPPPQLVMEINEKQSDSNNTTTRVRRLMDPVLLGCCGSLSIASSPTCLHARVKTIPQRKADPELHAKPNDSKLACLLQRRVFGHSKGHGWTVENELPTLFCHVGALRGKMRSRVPLRNTSFDELLSSAHARGWGWIN
jgi:hypothetical protein